MRFALASLAFLLLPGIALAASDRQNAPGGWSGKASIEQSAAYDSNPLRSVDHEEEIFGSITSPELELRYKTPRSVVESKTSIDLNRYDRDRYNSTDLHQNLLLATQNERWATGLETRFDRDTTRTSELTNFSLNLPRVHRDKISISPKLLFRPSTKESFGINANFADISYDHASYTDYRIASLAPYYQQRLDGQHDASIGLRAGRYETTQGASLISTSIGPELGLTTRHTPRLTSRLSAGAQATHKKGANAGSDPDGWNYVFSGSLNYTGEVDTLSLRATRAQEPFGNGTETLLTTFAIDEKHALTPPLALTGKASYQTADYSTEPGINLDHRMTAGGGFEYALTDALTLQADYQYRYENLTRVDGNVDQHLVLLGFNYHPSWSIF